MKYESPFPFHWRALLESGRWISSDDGGLDNRPPRSFPPLQDEMVRIELEPREGFNFPRGEVESSCGMKIVATREKSLNTAGGDFGIKTMAVRIEGTGGTWWFLRGAPAPVQFNGTYEDLIKQRG